MTACQQILRRFDFLKIDTGMPKEYAVVRSICTFVSTATHSACFSGGIPPLKGKALYLKNTKGGHL